MLTVQKCDLTSFEIEMSDMHTPPNRASLKIVKWPSLGVISIKIANIYCSSIKFENFTVLENKLYSGFEER